MKVIKNFSTEEEKENITAQMVAEGYALIETQYHFDGKHLIFENDEPEPEPLPPPKPRDLAAEIDEIKAKLADYDNLKAKVEALEKGIL